MQAGVPRNFLTQIGIPKGHEDSFAYRTAFSQLHELITECYVIDVQVSFKMVALLADEIFSKRGEITNLLNDIATAVDRRAGG